MSDWLIAAVALLALFAYALFERWAAARRDRDAWERSTQQAQMGEAPHLADVERLEAGKAEAEEAKRVAS